MTSGAESAVSALLRRAVAERVTPGGVVEVGSASGAAWTVRVGRLTYAGEAAAVTPDTVYDLASLTKVVATTSLAMRHDVAGTLPIDTAIASRLPAFHAHALITVADLLLHASGWPAHRPYYREVAGRAGFLARLAAEPIEYAPRSRHEYTDLGFLLLGLLIEEAGGASLATQFDLFAAEALGGVELAYGIRPPWRRHCAPTSVEAWRGRLLAGVVHDANASALGGAAGHAGLFGTAAAVGAFARWLLVLWHGDVRESAGVRSDTVARFTTRGAIPGSSRALGWDTMLPSSSCGSRLSPRAVGHTGFTGTSLWIDPDRDLYVVMLTNRVHPASEGDGIQALRIAVHDAIGDRSAQA